MSDFNILDPSRVKEAVSILEKGAPTEEEDKLLLDTIQMLREINRKKRMLTGNKIKGR